MFIITEMKDCIRIPPVKFNKPLKVAITEELNKKLSNKVVTNVGLGVALWDITKLGDSHILPGDGGHHTPVEFRFVMFRPFINEVLSGKVKSCSRDGVHVTLGFFDDIFIPETSLPHPSRFDEAEQVWVWEYQSDDGTHDLFMDVGEPIRFRVVAEKFEETSPAGPDSGVERESADQKIPYSLIGSISESGLGLKSWWNQAQEAADSGPEVEAETLNSSGEMLNALAAELSAIMAILERCHAVEHFTLSVAASRIPLAPAIGTLIASLITAVEECHARLEGLVGERLVRLVSPLHVEAPDSHGVVHGPSDREDWVSMSNEDYRQDTIAKAKLTPGGECLVMATSPECLEALNLSVAASPECFEAMNLSVATSPCYNAHDESKPLHEVNASTVFWDQVNLDVGNPSDCFVSEHLQGATNTNSDGLNLEFSHDIDSTSVLGDGYILDISSQVSVTDALNASIYFGLHRDGSDIPPQPLNPSLQGSAAAAALDLSHQGTSFPDSVKPNEPVVNSQCVNTSWKEKLFSCNLCGKVLRSKGSLRRHQEAHGEGHLVCDHCGRAFRGAWLLRRHVLAHISVHVCEICGKRCVDDRKLRRHIATHSAGTYNCNACRKSFSRPDGLKRHIDIIHLKSRDYCCLLCSRTFSVKCNLESHMDSVHGGKNVQCDVCGRWCKNKATFQKHVRIHGAPMLVCAVCKRSFHRRMQYRRHMKNQHGVLEC